MSEIWNKDFSNATGEEVRTAYTAFLNHTKTIIKDVEKSGELLQDYVPLPDKHLSLLEAVEMELNKSVTKINLKQD